MRKTLCLAFFAVATGCNAILGNEAFSTRDTSNASSCDPTRAPSQDACVVDEAYGVFASPLGNDAFGRGTRASPLKSISAALSQARSKGKRVYLCEGTYNESLLVEGGAGIAIFGGLSCGDWTYSSSRRAVIAVAGAGPAVTLKALSSESVLEDVEVHAGDAKDAGTSSIGVLLANRAGVTFRRAHLKAGAGAAGAPAAPFSGTNHFKMDLNAPPNHVGPRICPCGSDGNGHGKSTAGIAAEVGTHLAGDGTADPPPEPMVWEQYKFIGRGGRFNTATNQCEPAEPGGNGRPGKRGIRARTFGSTSAMGWTPAPAGNGFPGDPGGGGGGGAADLSGRGSPGASGGCGGLGGLGGGSGGSGIALLAVGSRTFLAGVTLQAGAGGRGGAGSTGEAGRGGGFGYSVMIPTGCPGGNGGTGAGGGGGAGGTGGLSVGIGYDVYPPIIDAVETPEARELTIVSVGAPGPGGVGGRGGPRAPNPAEFAQNGKPGDDGEAGLDGIHRAVLKL